MSIRFLRFRLISDLTQLTECRGMAPPCPYGKNASNCVTSVIELTLRRLNLTKGFKPLVRTFMVRKVSYRS